MAFGAQGCVAENGAMQVGVHFFDFLASVFVHADYVDEVSGGVEEGGVAGHVVAVPVCDQGGKDGFDFRSGGCGRDG